MTGELDGQSLEKFIENKPAARIGQPADLQLRLPSLDPRGAHGLGIQSVFVRYR